MSAVLHSYEPHRFSAGVLALLVHAAFFALLYFGVRWQSKPVETYTVEMWESLPNAPVAPEPQPTPPPPKAEPLPPVKVVTPVTPPPKADIELREKKHKKPEVKEKPVKKDDAKEKAALRAQQEAAERKELEKYAAKLEQARKAEQERIRNEVSTATRVQVERYQDLIRNRIRHKMVKQEVPDSAEAIFKVTLLPDGMLMDDPVLIKSSGYPAYDDAAARAIILAEPLPVPTDPSLQKMFRELKLSIRP